MPTSKRWPVADDRIGGYADALLAVASAEGASDVVEDELFRVAEAVRGSESLLATLADRHLPIDRRMGVVEDLLMALGVLGAAPLRWRTAGEGDSVPGWANPGRAQVLECGEGEESSALCFLAELDPGRARPLGLVEELASDVAAATVSLDSILTLPQAPASYRPLPKFPGAKVDVALALPEGVSCADAEVELERSGKGLVASMELFERL